MSTIHVKSYFDVGVQIANELTTRGHMPIKMIVTGSCSEKQAWMIEANRIMAQKPRMAKVCHTVGIEFSRQAANVAGRLELDKVVRKMRFTCQNR